LGAVDFDGVQEPYFFENSFTNHPPRNSNDCMKQTIEKKFAEANKFVFSNGLGHLASQGQDGVPILDEDSNFPFEVIMVPNRELFPKTAMVEDEDMLGFFEKWQPIYDAEGDIVPVTIFTVKARHYYSDKATPEADLPTIARIELTSDLYRSTFGDERLFFQHESLNRDFKRMNNQGEAGEQRRKEIKANVPKHDSDDGLWGDTPINPLPADNDEAKAIIEEGMLGLTTCPFAWLLA
jgi:hypothetical protein